MEDLPEELGGAYRPAEDLYGDFGSLAAGVTAFERVYVVRVLAEEGGSVSAAAARLGLSRESLEEKMKAL